MCITFRFFTNSLEDLTDQSFSREIVNRNPIDKLVIKTSLQ